MHEFKIASEFNDENPRIGSQCNGVFVRTFSAIDRRYEIRERKKNTRSTEIPVRHLNSERISDVLPESETFIKVLGLTISKNEFEMS